MRTRPNISYSLPRSGLSTLKPLLLSGVSKEQMQTESPSSMLTLRMVAFVTEVVKPIYWVDLGITDGSRTQ